MNARLTAGLAAVAVVLLLCQAVLPLWHVLSEHVGAVACAPQEAGVGVAVTARDADDDCQLCRFIAATAHQTEPTPGHDPLAVATPVVVVQPLRPGDRIVAAAAAPAWARGPPRIG